MTIHNKSSIDVIGITRCTGCFGCESACALGAIEMVLDDDGFYKPIVDHKKCSECGICQRYCPVLMKQKHMICDEKKVEPKAFAAWTNDEQVRMSSSSGGVFSELAKIVIKSGGMVAGCVWGEKWSPMHILTDHWPDVERMRGSKYLQSNVGKIYQKVLDVLRETDKQVLFSGTPCQIAAMKEALSPEQRERVLLVDFICHGVPSLRVFHRYLEDLFDGEDVASYTFRDKSFGWKTTVLAVSSNGKRHHLPAPSDPFFQGFAVHHLYVMEACYQCQFARIPRFGDITLGDFWGCPEKWYDKRGVSVVLANTNAGYDAVECLHKSMAVDLKSVELSVAIAKNKRASLGDTYRIPKKRKRFLKSLKKGDDFKLLKRRYFPKKIHLFMRSLLSSGSKSRFISLFILRRLGL
ncbi:4Fe-4S dicluster domain-containing protein [Chlorobaculum thiosulfatiphilum]|uniref:4Fe-4S dicluster domain-containing protein n=1 Tax=Chlorobaculum thiosulfatiphilum TaxID=115852 RepID=A0A5C4S4W4_CHLTI|nr:Coenzyme F420 hydrogenase/dehydrogenase, beta subunit C-terminal domain [Chlorobaculum thiosulfatiphilum]TNJ38553.1 4Fe-4S dicluster domain-containing protein [Chlorobaculum thiosulfatiphilum]